MPFWAILVGRRVHGCIRQRFDERHCQLRRRRWLGRPIWTRIAVGPWPVPASPSRCARTDEPSASAKCECERANEKRKGARGEKRARETVSSEVSAMHAGSWAEAAARRR